MTIDESDLPGRRKFDSIESVRRSSDDCFGAHMMDERSHVSDEALDQILLKLNELGERIDRMEADRAGGGAIQKPDLFEFQGNSDELYVDRKSTFQKSERATRAPLPDPRLMRRIIRSRQQRSSYFNGDLFADPAWDMLLDLAAARAEHGRVSVTSLCIASGVPPTTALRWISQMVDEGWFHRIEDDTDRRRAFVALSDKGADAMARYFAGLGRIAAQLV